MPFPDIDYCIICEAVRPEGGGKLSLLGFYGMAPQVEILVVNIAQPVQLFFVIGMGASEREEQYVHTVTLSDSHGTVIAQTPATTARAVPRQRGVLAFGIVVRFPADGLYNIQVQIDGRMQYQTSFGLRQARPAEQDRVGHIV